MTTATDWNSRPNLGEEDVKPLDVTRAQMKAWVDELNGVNYKAEQLRAPFDGKREDMSGQAVAEYEKAMADSDKLCTKLAEANRFLEAKKVAKTTEDMLKELSIPKNPLAMGAPAANSDGKSAAATKHQQMFKKYLQANTKQDEFELQSYAKGDEFVKAMKQDALLKGVDPGIYTKAYQMDNPTGGGFAVLPMQMAEQILTLMKDLVFMRGLATVLTCENASSLGILAIDTDPSDSDWTGELLVGNEETTVAISRRELKPNPLAKYIKVSKKLLRASPGYDQHILDRLLYKVGITQEKGFIVGTSANQPLGVAVADSNGIPTSRDVATITAGTLVGDDYIKLKYSLKAQYQAKASCLMHRQNISLVRRLKDTTNNYIFASGGAIGGLGPGGGLQGTPETLVGIPLLISEYMPDPSAAGTLANGSLTTGTYNCVMGAFEYYYIADALGITMQVLYELFALTNQQGYVLRSETDGMPVLSEAFARQKIA